MAHGATHDAAKHIAAPFVRRRDAVGDEKGAGAQMVGDHPMAHAARVFGVDARRDRGPAPMSARMRSMA